MTIPAPAPIPREEDVRLTPQDVYAFEELDLDLDGPPRPVTPARALSTGLAVLLLAAQQLVPVSVLPASPTSSGSCEATGAAVCMCRAPKTPKPERKPEAPASSRTAKEFNRRDEDDDTVEED